MRTTLCKRSFAVCDIGLSPFLNDLFQDKTRTPVDQSIVNSLVSDLRKQDKLEARDERRHLDVDVEYGKTPHRLHTLADSLVQFSHRLAESDTSSEFSRSTRARAPISLGTQDNNRAALQIARETAPDDQVPPQALVFPSPTCHS